MNAHLLYRNKDFNIEETLVWNHETLVQDFGLQILFDRMANGDDLLFKVAKTVMLSSALVDETTIYYRQEVLKDCLANKAVVETMYQLAIEAEESRKHTWYSIFTKYPSSLLSSSAGLINIYLGHLKKLRDFVKEQENNFRSEAFLNLFSTLQKEISDEYIEAVTKQLSRLKFRNGILISAQIGTGNKGTNYALHSFTAKKLNWLRRLFPPKLPGYTFQIPPRDESGARAVSELNDNAIRQVANTLANAYGHILAFFTALRNELAFYVGCINLHKRFSELELPACFPKTSLSLYEKHHATQLYDPCLALSMDRKIEANDFVADDKNLVIITGANKGGESTFLRSVGTAQLMMQSGMFVAAETFESNLCNSVCTHFKREEDRTMNSGKFDEELKRMDDIARHLTGASLLLFNESFASTNEREGSEISRQIVCALTETGHKVLFVTHLFDFSNGYYQANDEHVLFLHAKTSGHFILEEAPPEKRGNGIGMFYEIFSGSETQRACIPYHRTDYTEAGKATICRHVINTGLVGKPKQSDNRAYSILIDIGPRFDLRKPEVVRAAFKFVPYDVEVVGKHLQKIGLPCAYDSFLRESR